MICKQSVFAESPKEETKKIFGTKYISFKISLTDIQSWNIIHTNLSSNQ